MRTVLILVLACAISALGEGRPLTNQEIALMLRSGYSSESVLREVAERRVVDQLDTATRKTLLDVGASAELIRALDDGSFLLGPAEAERARQQQAEVALRRQAQVDEEKRFITLYQAKARARAAAAAAASTSAATGTPILESIRDKLVRCQDGTVRPADPAALEKKKLVALYYSAHSSAACRKFTADLVDYYNRVEPAHSEFEIIFVSFDRSRFNWETFLRETRMPWLAIDYDQLDALDGLRQLGGGSIPSLLILDANSQIVASSYDGDKYLGPQSALAALDQIFARNAAAGVNTAR